MRSKFGTEVWIAGRGAFIFRYQDPRSGEKWAFCVAQSTLADLATMDRFVPSAIFEIWKTKIYRAAELRMQIANARSQQNLSTEDIRRADTAAHRSPVGYMSR